MLYSTKKTKIGSRIYNSEVYMNNRGNNIIKNIEYANRIKELISASQIYRLEIYLSTGIRSRIVTSKEETKRIADKYKLEKTSSGSSNTKYKGDPQIIYNELRKDFTDIDWDTRFPNHDGKGYKRLVYALLYGESKCTIIKNEDK